MILKARWTIGIVVCLAIVLVALLDMVGSVRPMSQSDSDGIVAAMAKLGVPTGNVKFMWLVGWRGRVGAKRGLCASYRVISHTVTIPECYRDMIHDPIMHPTIAHELTHADQSERMGAVLYLPVKIFCRDRLEAEAELVEMRILETLTERQDALD